MVTDRRDAKSSTKFSLPIDLLVLLIFYWEEIIIEGQVGKMEIFTSGILITISRNNSFDETFLHVNQRFS